MSDPIKGTYRDIPKGRIVVWSSAVGLPEGVKELWHWQRLSPEGVLVDSSGPSRDGLETKAEVKKLIKDRYPHDDVEGL